LKLLYHSSMTKSHFDMGNAGYNFLRPHEGLSGKTPAEVAKIDYQVKNWADVSRLPVSKTDYDVTRLEPRDAAEKPLLTGFGLENRI